VDHAGNPEVLKSAVNEVALEYLRELSARDEVAEALWDAVAPLGDVQSYSPDLFQYRYVAVATCGIIFGFAIGMSHIGFRLSPEFKARALAIAQGVSARARRSSRLIGGKARRAYVKCAWRLSRPRGRISPCWSQPEKSATAPSRSRARISPKEPRSRSWLQKVTRPSFFRLRMSVDYSPPSARLSGVRSSMLP